MRVLCIVPGCSHSRGDRRTSVVTEDMEFICREHWAVVPRHWRRRLRLFEKRGRLDLAERMWSRIKRLAIERAVGI